MMLDRIVELTSTFFSVPVADTESGPFPIAQFIVEDSNPVWVYCRQANHCQQGMVFAINPGDKFAAFQAAAMGGQAPVPSSSSATVQYTLPTQRPPVISASPVSSAVPRPSLSTTGTQQSAGLIPSVSSPALPSASPSTPGVIEHRVIVGGPNRLFFSPANISVAVGDVIAFQFMQKNHTVTQSTFANPCVSLTESSTSGQIGFDSGLCVISSSAVIYSG
jgi:plastocyanin